MGKKKDTSPADETPREKFKKVVEPRVRKAIKAISLIGNCAGGSYEYNPADIAHITMSLKQAVIRIEKRYATKGKQQADFDLD